MKKTIAVIFTIIIALIFIIPTAVAETIMKKSEI
jgi:hypothetical protein